MTKKELIERLAEIYSAVDNLEDSLKGAMAEVKDIRRFLDEIPDEEAEITDERAEE